MARVWRRIAELLSLITDPRRTEVEHRRPSETRSRMEAEARRTTETTVGNTERQRRDPHAERPEVRLERSRTPQGHDDNLTYVEVVSGSRGSPSDSKTDHAMHMQGFSEADLRVGPKEAPWEEVRSKKKKRPPMAGEGAQKSPKRRETQLLKTFSAAEADPQWSDRSMREV
ncbi:hypothetical protein J5N97_024368 [Dioscorea zingiberensis]|uniref:Uncharacterized protein n=1 Tax=Dioscorea zingiberensis TaxID=325984 RepID=A0A9D5C689_9LILI|nr:hypothetical protein J5N97_024368 [Dioscorea zingiberensis]